VFNLLASTTWRGKILRLDVDQGGTYVIPSDNPFASSGGNPRAEIYALGVRNPFRGDVDPVTGKLYVADVGFNTKEEVSEVFSGANMGWNIKEGTNCHSEQYGSCSNPALVDPLIEYSHTDGNCSVIGGFFYRGSAIPALDGRFLFGDYCTGKISAVELDNGGNPFELSLIAGGAGPGNIHTFAKDNAGELYAVTSSQIHKIVPTSGSGTSGPASQLSQTGCFEPADATVPAAGPGTSVAARPISSSVGSFRVLIMELAFMPVSPENGRISQVRCLPSGIGCNASVSSVR